MARIPDTHSAHLGRRDALVSVPLVRSEWLVVTHSDLIAVAEDGIRVEIPWIAVESARWDGDRRTYIVNLIDGQTAEFTADTDDVWLLVTAIREQVNSSIVHVEYLATNAGGEVRALVRKDSRGELSSQIIARGPVSAAEEAAVDELERRARAAVGLTTP